MISQLTEKCIFLSVIFQAQMPKPNIECGRGQTIGSPSLSLTRQREIKHTQWFFESRA